MRSSIREEVGLATSIPTTGRRLSIITVDQIISGGSNFLALIAAAHLLDLDDFGRYGVVFLTFVVVQSIARALVSEPCLVHPEAVTARPGQVLTSGITTGLALGVMLAVGGLVITLVEPRLGWGLVVLGVLFPFLTAQDLGRYLGIARHRPGEAFVLDLVWLLLMLAGLGWLLTHDGYGIATMIAVWGGSGALAGLLTFWLHRPVPVRLGFEWLASTWSLAWRYLITNLVNHGAALSASLVVLIVVGARSLGALQAAQILTRPFSVFLVAATSAGVSELARLVRTDAGFARGVRRTTLLVSTVACVNLVILVVLPDSLGKAILGGAWSAADPLLLPAGLQLVLIGLLSGARIGLYGMRRMGVVVGLDVVATAMMLVALVIGLQVNGILGAMWAIVIAQAVVMIATLLVFTRTREGLPEAQATVSAPREAGAS